MNTPELEGLKKLIIKKDEELEKLLGEYNKLEAATNIIIDEKLLLENKMKGFNNRFEESDKIIKTLTAEINKLEKYLDSEKQLNEGLVFQLNYDKEFGYESRDNREEQSEDLRPDSGRNISADEAEREDARRRYERDRPRPKRTISQRFFDYWRTGS